MFATKLQAVDGAVDIIDSAPILIVRIWRFQ